MLYAPGRAGGDPLSPRNRGPWDCKTTPAWRTPRERQVGLNGRKKSKHRDRNPHGLVGPRTSYRRARIDKHVEEGDTRLEDARIDGLDGRKVGSDDELVDAYARRCPAAVVILIGGGYTAVEEEDGAVRTRGGRRGGCSGSFAWFFFFFWIGSVGYRFLGIKRAFALVALMLGHEDGWSTDMVALALPTCRIAILTSSCAGGFASFVNETGEFLKRNSLVRPCFVQEKIFEADRFKEKGNCP